MSPLCFGRCGKRETLLALLRETAFSTTKLAGAGLQQVGPDRSFGRQRRGSRLMRSPRSCADLSAAECHYQGQCIADALADGLQPLVEALEKLKR